MEYKDIVSVTGMSGLFQLLSTKSDGAILRSLDDQVARFVPTRTHNFTPLESIEVFTTGDNVTLADVFRAMQEKEDTHPLPAAGAESGAIKAYFREVFPALDEERVYVSDMKKMLKWYPVLKEHDLLKVEDAAAEAEETPAEETPAEEAPAAEKAPEPAPAKKKKSAAASAKKADSGEKAPKEKAPAEKKKAAPKKKKAGD